MKISLPADILQKKLSIVHKALSAKADLPILSNLYLQAKDRTLLLRSTDLEIGIETTMVAEIEEEGELVVPAKTFIELVNSFPQEIVTLRTTDKGLEVRSKKTKSVFQIGNAEEFPRLFEEKGHVLATLKTKDLKSDFGCVIFAASTESSRPALSGVLMKKEENGFLLVATDGYRLSLKHTLQGQQNDVQAVQEEKALIIPARVFREVLSLKESGENITVYGGVENNQVIFAYGETMLVGRLIEAEFPPYERIIPADFSLVIRFDREELLKAVKVCAIFARDTANIITLSCKKDSIIVSSASTTVGENEVKVDAQLKGEENDIAFNAKYLLDALSNIEKNDLTFEMTGPLNPGVFKEYEDPSFLHLIMPIKVQN